MNATQSDLSTVPISSPSFDLSLLQEGCKQLGLPLTEQQLAHFALFYQELITWNEKFNLTGITELAEVQTKHFLDSLVCTSASSVMPVKLNFSFQVINS